MQSLFFREVDSKESTFYTCFIFYNGKLSLELQSKKESVTSKALNRAIKSMLEYFSYFICNRIIIMSINI